MTTKSFPALDVEALSHRYGEKRALSDFSYGFRRGITAVLGPNGAGKSTLMNLIADCLRRQTGRILYDGVDVLQHGRRFRDVLGYMPQDQGCYPDFSARAFLRYMAALKGLDARRAKVQIEALLNAHGLAAAAHRRLGGFSGGMRQRVLLCQALLGEPQVLILDEPTAGLDPGEHVRLREEIAALGQTRIVIITTHITSDVEHIADALLLIHEGRRLAAGSPADWLADTGARTLEGAYLHYMATGSGDA